MEFATIRPEASWRKLSIVHDISSKWLFGLSSVTSLSARIKSSESAADRSATGKSGMSANLESSKNAPNLSSKIDGACPETTAAGLNSALSTASVRVPPGGIHASGPKSGSARTLCRVDEVVIPAKKPGMTSMVRSAASSAHHVAFFMAVSSHDSNRIYSRMGTTGVPGTGAKELKWAIPRFASPR